MSTNSSETLGSLAPPPGVTPDFVSPYSRGWYVTLTSALCLGFATVFVCVRLYSRVYILKSRGWEWEDYTCVLAWLGFIAFVVIGFQLKKNGIGVHQWNVSQMTLGHFYHWVNIVDIVYPLVMALTKLSILFQYLRIFVTTRKSMVYLCVQILIWLVLLFHLSQFILAFMVCVPIAKEWNASIPGHCINYYSAMVSTASFNLFTDLAMLLFPLICIWRLQMKTSRKAGLSAVFAVGLFACVASLMRIITSVQSYHNPDFTFHFLSLGLWTIAEIATGIVVGCFPAMPAFFNHFVPKLKSPFRSIRTSNSNPKRSTASLPSRHHLSGWEPDVILTPNATYMELGENGRNCTTSVKGGWAVSSTERLQSGDQDLAKYGYVEAGRTESAVRAENGILKTVRIETRDDWC